MESAWIHNKIVGNGGLILSRTHLLIINYAMDENSQVFSHQVDLVNKLAEKYDKVSVLTGLVGFYEVSNNVEVISFNWVQGKKFLSLFRFVFMFFQVLSQNQFSCIFSHMTSVQSAFISPITRVLRIKHYLWYAHRSNNIYLLISSALTNGVITSTPGSCPIKGRKVFAIGQSVDSKVFDRKSRLDAPIKNLIHIGRFDPYKNIEEIVTGVKKIRDTYPTFVYDAKVDDKVDRPHGLREERRQLDVSTPLTPAAGHLGCRYLGACEFLAPTGRGRPRGQSETAGPDFIPAVRSD